MDLFFCIGGALAARVVSPTASKLGKTDSVRRLKEEFVQAAILCASNLALYLS